MRAPFDPRGESSDGNDGWLKITIQIKRIGIFAALCTIAWFIAKPLLEASVGRIVAPYAAMAADYAHDTWDGLTCGGKSAMAAGDRLSELASKDAARAQLHLTEANAHYSKAYGCGFPDAGIRLAVSHCLGLGTPKNLQKARQIVLEIEAKHTEKTGRAGDVRKLCGM